MAGDLISELMACLWCQWISILCIAEGENDSEREEPTDTNTNSSERLLAEILRKWKVEFLQWQLVLPNFIFYYKREGERKEVFLLVQMTQQTFWAFYKYTFIKYSFSSSHICV